MKRIRELVGKVCIIRETFHVRRPYAIVILDARIDDPALAGDSFTGVGIAKACWPDRWSDKKGYTIALGRAKVDIARQADAEVMINRIADLTRAYQEITAISPARCEWTGGMVAPLRPLCDLDEEHNIMLEGE